MRKLLIIAFLALAVLPARAQRPRVKLEWGGMAGLNIVDFSTSDDATAVRNKLGWQAGIVTAVDFGAFAIEPQILYVRQGLRLRPKGEPELNLKSSSIDVPVLVSLRLLRPVRIYAGPVFTVMSRSRRATCSTSGACGRRSPSRWVPGCRSCDTCSWTCATTASSRARRMWRSPRATYSTSSASTTSHSASATSFSL